MGDDAAAPPPAVIAVDGELDAADTDWAREIAAALDAGARDVVLDMRNVTFIDSSVVRQLLLLHRKVPQGGALRLVYTHHLIRRVIDIVGLGELFPQYSTVDAALRNSRRGDGRVSPGGDHGHTEHDTRSRTGTSQPPEEA